MDTHTTDVNPAELSRSQAMWVEFTRFAKYGIVSVVALLILMAIFLL